VSIHWKLFARNKKSLCLDLRKGPAREILMRLIPGAHMLVESFRPGTLEKMGLAPDTLLEINPRLVITRISGWGQSGPYSKRPGFGTLIEGMSGFAALNGFADREPVLPPMYLADGIAGLYGASAAMIALRNVETNGGRGQVIDLPLLDPLFTVLGPHAAAYRLTGEVKPRTGSRSTNSAPRNAFKCSDGRYVGLSASTEKMAQRLFHAIGRPELTRDPRYATNAARLQNADTLEPIIANFIATRTQAENVAFFEAAEVTIGPIYDISQIVQDPHVIDRELVADYPDPEMGLFPMHHVVPRLAGTPASIRSAAPALGEHNRAILAELGVTDADFQALVAAGALCQDESAASVDE
jgi:formyl-CoA transferase